MDKNNKALLNRISDLVDDGNISELMPVFEQHPEMITVYFCANTWLHEAARAGHVNLVKRLIDLGLDVNAKQNGFPLTPLYLAVMESQVSAARILLANGADANANRVVISAIVGDKPNALEMVKLLEEFGADLHAIHMHDTLKKPINALSTALDWGKDDVAAYLRSRGAVLPEDEPEKVKRRSMTLANEVVAHFEQRFGPVNKQALIEIVPSEPSITIHAVPAGEERDHLTLFTTGMSEQPMTVPDGDEQFQFAELFIQLPVTWPLSKDKLSEPRWGWPIHWLRNTAKYPHQFETWLGGPVTIIVNGDPPEPLAPKVPFTSMLLMAEAEFTSQSGKTVQLYRLTPLYSEEREMEIKDGVPALMRAFDRLSVPFVVDLKRPNVAI